MDYSLTSQLVRGSVSVSGVPVEQLFLSNPPAFFIGANKDTRDLAKGTPVSVHPSGTGFVRASSASTSLSAYGLLAEDAPIGVAVSVCVQGTFVIEDWSRIIGTANLVPKAFYYLTTDPGMLTNVSPVTPGQISQIMGEAISPVALELTLMRYILL